MIRRFWNRYHVTTLACAALLALLIALYVSMQMVESDCARKGGDVKWIPAGKGVSSLCLSYDGRVLE